MDSGWNPTSMSKGSYVLLRSAGVTALASKVNESERPSGIGIKCTYACISAKFYISRKRTTKNRICMVTKTEFNNSEDTGEIHLLTIRRQKCLFTILSRSVPGLRWRPRCVSDGVIWCSFQLCTGHFGNFGAGAQPHICSVTYHLTPMFGLACSQVSTT